MLQKRNGLNSWKQALAAGREDEIWGILDGGREKLSAMHQIRALVQNAGWPIPWPHSGLRMLAGNKSPEEIRDTLPGLRYLSPNTPADTLIDRLLENDPRWNPC